jgi:hypothetical protein
LDARANLNDLANPPIVEVCHLLQQLSPASLPPAIADICNQLAPVLSGALPLPSAAQVLTALQQGKLPPLPLPLAGIVFGTPTGGTK